MVTLREIPFVRLLLPLVLGIFVAIQVEKYHPSVLIVFMLSGGVMAYVSTKSQSFRFRWAYGILLNFLLFLFGYLFTYNYGSKSHPQYLGSLIDSTSQYQLIGVVTDQPVKKEWIKVRLRAKVIFTPEGIPQKVEDGLMLYVQADSLSLRLEYGDEILVRTGLKPIDHPKNPNAFDYRRYLHLQDIHYQAFVRVGDWKLLRNDAGNRVVSFALKSRERLISVLRKYIHTENEFAVAAALTVGYTSEIPDEIRQTYTATGSMHVLAVSGLHVGIIFLMVGFLLRPLDERRTLLKWLKFLLSLAAIWSFALLTGSTPSVVRAAAMFSLILFGKFLDRDQNIYNTMAASVFLCCCTILTTCCSWDSFCHIWRWWASFISTPKFIDFGMLKTK
jgi:competence protein ComEC